MLLAQLKEGKGYKVSNKEKNQSSPILNAPLH
jgi:hypothetical protein